MVLRPWHLLVVFGMVACLSVGFAAGMLASGQKKSRTSTVVQVLSAAGPSQEEQDQTAAKANVRAMIPAMEAYNADNVRAGDAGGYAGVSVSMLRDTYDSGIDESAVSIPYANSTTYCVQSTVGNATWSKSGPGAYVVSGGC